MIVPPIERLRSSLKMVSMPEMQYKRGDGIFLGLRGPLFTRPWFRHVSSRTISHLITKPATRQDEARGSQGRHRREGESRENLMSVLRRRGDISRPDVASNLGWKVTL